MVFSIADPLSEIFTKHPFTACSDIWEQYSCRRHQAIETTEEAACVQLCGRAVCKVFRQEPFRIKLLGGHRATETEGNRAGNFRLAHFSPRVRPPYSRK